jgi:hypothetical protein
MLWLFLGLAVVIFLAHSVVTAFFPYPLDYGEAPLVDQAMRLAAGQSIYRPDVSAPPYTISNYPPLFVLALLPFVELFGPAFLVGRAISIVCTLAATAFLTVTTYTLSKDRLAASVTGMLFLATPFVVHWSAFLRVDMLALALSTAALCVIARWPTEQRSTVLAALLLVAAIYTRQSYALASPLAAFVWLWAHERRRAIELALLVGGLVVSFFLCINLITHGGFFYNIVAANVNEFGMERLGRWLKDLRETAPILLLLGGVFVFLAPAKGMPAWPLLVPYLIGAALSALTIGKIGSNVNYFLELAAASSLVGGAYIWWSRERPWLRNLLLLVLVLQAGWLLRETLDGPVAYVASRAEDLPALDELDDMVAAVDGPVLADEHMGLTTLHERPLFFQPFEITQLARAGLWDQTTILQDIENHRFPLILVYQFAYSSGHEERWTAEMLAAIKQYYRPAQNLAGDIVYQPKGEREAEDVSGSVQQATFHPADVKMGPIQRFSQMPYVYEPGIAASPVESDHLAATVIATSDVVCNPPDCRVNLLLYTSIDGGGTWQEQVPLDKTGQESAEGMAAFGPDGTLYVVGLNSHMNVSRALVDSPIGPYRMVQANAVSVPSSQVYPQPSLVIDARDEKLYLVYSGRYQSNLGILLKRSAAGGDDWTYAVPVDEGVPLSDLEKGRATPLLGPQLMLGEKQDLVVAWAWGPGYWRWPIRVWVATSHDAGMTFSAARGIADTWSLVSATAHNGKYYIFYRWGTEQDQQLVLTSSNDGGNTWTTSSVSGDLPVATDWSKAPGVDVAPDGTIDIAYYVQNADASGCELEMEEWRQAHLGETWTDTCIYDVYYSYSKDGGQTFSEPVQLNEEPIRGERFLRLNGSSVAGLRFGMASTDEYAYPVWIETQGQDGTQAYTVRIER